MRTCSVDVFLASLLQASPTASLGPFDEKTETWGEWVGIGLSTGSPTRVRTELLVERGSLEPQCSSLRDSEWRGWGHGACALTGLELTWSRSGGRTFSCELTCCQRTAWETQVWTVAKDQNCSRSEACACLRTQPGRGPPARGSPHCWGLVGGSWGVADSPKSTCASSPLTHFDFSLRNPSCGFLFPLEDTETQNKEVTFQSRSDPGPQWASPGACFPHLPIVPVVCSHGQH